ncbi:Sua5/YciO/YrdC/YwlC family protein [Mycoplasmopsis lipofaciens]|uniref:Sua5/YciO/YrdC/YwlC family protein n=1 Tax=Mycoplasmopsis lipofaciens TaxID=114884 RepID=UPI00048926E1|nr:Sua5/YciO/YrdC/YwlC family protein [Mycoplasmopsis lipofaciens]
MNYSKLFICTTDTVTGLGGPIEQNTLDCIYKLKERPKNKKIMILVGSIEQARKFQQWNTTADDLAKKYWPGAVSIIANNQGFRMPKDKSLCKFLLKHGAMYVTSANKSGQMPIDIRDSYKIFPEITNVFIFGKPKGQASKIINSDTNEWLR